METETTTQLASNPRQGDKSDSDFRLSTYLASGSAEIMYRQYMASPKSSLFASKRVTQLIYGDNVTREQLGEVYGTMPLL